VTTGSGGVRVAWERGGEASLERLAGELVTLHSTVPSPPGSRIEGALTIAGEQVAAKLRVKIHASRRSGDGTFVLEGRALDLTRDLREKLAGAIVARGE